MRFFRVAIFLFICLLPVSVFAQNLVDNPGFEAGVSPWITWGGTLVQSSEQARTGNWSALSQNRTEVFHGPVQSLLGKMEAGRSYRISAWVRVKQNTSAPFRITVAKGDDNGTSFTSAASGSASDVQWTQLSDIFALSADGPITRLEVYVEGPPAGVDFYVDDVEVEALPEDWEAAANQRIDMLRKRDVTVSVLGVDDQPVAGAEVRLQQLKRDFPLGMVMSHAPFQNEVNYREYIADRFTWAVHENEAKWYANESSRDVITYEKADAILDWAEARGIQMRGHTIFWAPQQWQPNWAKSLVGNELETEVTDRLESVVTHFKGRLRHWDVNNEMLHGSFFRDRLGGAIVPWMFNRTREIDPDAKLFVNDFSVVSNSQRTDDYVAQIQGLLNQGVPVDAIGVQGHFTDVDPEAVLFRLDKLAQFGLPVWVTEFDVVQADVNDRADHLEWFMRAAFSHPSVEGIMLWGFWEGSHWRGPDAALVDQDWTVNPAGQRLDELLAEWNSDETQTTGGSGSAGLRVFHGAYRVEVTGPGGATSVAEVYVPPGEGALLLTVDLSLIQANGFEPLTVTP